MGTIVETTDIQSVWGALATATLSGFKCLVGGVQTSIVASAAPAFTLSIDLNYKGAMLAFLPNQDIQVQFYLEGLGGTPEPNSPVVQTQTNIVPATAPYQSVNANVVNPGPGIYRIAAMVRSRNTGTTTNVMFGFIEGLVIEVV